MIKQLTEIQTDWLLSMFFNKGALVKNRLSEDDLFFFASFEGLRLWLFYTISIFINRFITHWIFHMKNPKRHLDLRHGEYYKTSPSHHYIKMFGYKGIKGDRTNTWTRNAVMVLKEDKLILNVNFTVDPRKVKDNT